MLEIALTRIFSVTMWYHFAFVAISVALFGMTVGRAHRPPAARTGSRDDGVHAPAVARTRSLFAVSIAALLRHPAGHPVHARTSPWAASPSVVGTCVVISVPFVFSGIVVCLALTRFPDRVNRLYAADLIGAALGCVALVVLFSLVRRAEPA